jgi:hypothetical protein
MKPCQTLLSQNTQRRGRTRNKRKGPMIKPKNRNPHLGGGGKEKEWEKVVYPPTPYPHNHKKHVKKGKGMYTRNNTYLRRTFTS